MNQDQMLLRAARLLERASQRRPAKPELPVEPWDLLEVYFADPCRPRLTPTAYLVWSYLLRRAEAESRIATVSYRELRMKTGILSTRSLRHALQELARLGYCVPSQVPTGPGMPKNYKIPDHIGTKRFAHPDIERLRRQADQPRKRRKKPALLQTLAAPQEPRPPARPPPWERISKAAGPAVAPTPPAPAPSSKPPLLEVSEAALPELPALNLEQKVAQATKEVDMILNLLNQNKKP